MATDEPRLLELRRRVQEDPASPDFVLLAEEYRRAGANADAVEVCRAGLVHHPDNLTARVTLGRALIELDRFDEAFTELTSVLDAAPDNLPAIRAVAEIYQHRGMMSEALAHYRRALQLAQPDSDLPHADFTHPVEQGQRTLPPEPPPTAEPPPVGELFDFDSLLAQLNVPGTEAPTPSYVPLTTPPGPVDAAQPPADDSFAVMEQQLREREEQRLLEEKQAREAEAERHRAVVIQELEHWLEAIVHNRHSHRPR